MSASRLPDEIVLGWDCDYEHLADVEQVVPPRSMVRFPFFDFGGGWQRLEGTTSLLFVRQNNVSQLLFIPLVEADRPEVVETLRERGVTVTEEVRVVRSLGDF